MREHLHTIPVNDAFQSGDECPFCYLERMAEQRTIRFVAGPSASYMEPEIRDITNEVGFCPQHTKKLYDYGNILGNALILQTYYARILEDFRKEAEQFEMPPKKTLLPRKKTDSGELYWQRLEKKVGSCYICEKIEYNMERYYHTFFALLKEGEFRSRVEHSKGFCLRHFARLLRTAEDKLPNSQRDWFYSTVFPLMEENLVRVKEDLDWLVSMYDYRNAGADWRNSRDALQRAMQKMEGLHPADPPYKVE